MKSKNRSFRFNLAWLGSNVNEVSKNQVIRKAH